MDRATQEQHEFESLTAADEFLGRFKGYTGQRVNREEIAYSAKTDDEYEVILGEDRRSCKGGRQPCEKCKNFAGGCEWSERFQPVPDWVAIPTKINSTGYGGAIDSYRIIYCPKFLEG